MLVVARDISADWHVRMQAAFQRHTDNGVSKTVNLPRYASVETVRQTYLRAHELGCKGVTVYREGSRNEDLLHSGAAPAGTTGRTPGAATIRTRPRSITASTTPGTARARSITARGLSPPATAT